MNNTRKRIELLPSKIIENQTIKPGVHYIKIERNFDFMPGQVIALAMEPNDEPRLYSIASGKNENYLGILFDIYPDGALTPTLSQIKNGDTVYISAPFGKFLCEHKPAMWIATGTGVAPFISLAQSNQAADVVFLHGSRTLDGFFFQELFKHHLSDNYLRFCTSESSEAVHEGRLTNHLKEQKSLPTDYKYYLCGSAQMIIDVREILISKQVAFENIIAEIYF